MDRVSKSNNSTGNVLLFKQIAFLVAKISIILLVLIALILFLVSKFSPESAGSKQNEVVGFFYPLTSAVDKTRRYIVTIFTEIDHVVNANWYSERLRKVEEERFKLNLELFLIKQENERLRKITNYLPNTKKEFYSARIISVNPGPYVKQAFIESSELRKINEKSIVINEDGLVGQVENISSNIATLIMLTDKRSKVPVKSRNSGKRAILAGTGERNPELDFILSTKKLIVGEEILTSGDGGVFPADIPVGYIEKIENDRVYIETFVDWNSLDYVFVVK